MDADCQTEGDIKIDLHLPEELARLLEQRCKTINQDSETIIRNALSGYLHHKRNHSASIYVSAPVNALVEGIYQENTTLADIRQHGDFGIGTFNNLDGEMVLLDGTFYQLKADGDAYIPTDETCTPFACVNFFSPDSTEHINQPLFYPDLVSMLERMIPSPNMVYAIRIEGSFNYVKTRSVPRQENYRPLVEVTREQPIFEFSNIDGVMTGYYTPFFMDSLAVPGWHLHFLTADRQHGGHLLDCSTNHIDVAIQHLPKIELGLPVTLDYLTTDFKRNTKKDIQEAESDH